MANHSRVLAGEPHELYKKKFCFSTQESQSLASVILSLSV